MRRAQRKPNQKLPASSRKAWDEAAATSSKPKLNLVYLRSSVVILTLILQLILQLIERAGHLNSANATHLAGAILPCYKYLRAE
jgi:hypothetical protein